MKKQVQIEDALLNVIFALGLVAVAIFFFVSAVDRLVIKEIGEAIFGAVCAAACVGASWLLLKNVWSTPKNNGK